MLKKGRRTILGALLSVVWASRYRGGRRNAVAGRVLNFDWLAHVSERSVTRQVRRLVHREESFRFQQVGWRSLWEFKVDGLDVIRDVEVWLKYHNGRLWKGWGKVVARKSKVASEDCLEVGAFRIEQLALLSSRIVDAVIYSQDAVYPQYFLGQTIAISSTME